VFFDVILPMLLKDAKEVSDEEKLENLTYFLGVSIGIDPELFSVFLLGSICDHS
jgi:hypothetical protein